MRRQQWFGQWPCFPGKQPPPEPVLIHISRQWVNYRDCSHILSCSVGCWNKLGHGGADKPWWQDEAWQDCYQTKSEENASSRCSRCRLGGFPRLPPDNACKPHHVVVGGPFAVLGTGWGTGWRACWLDVQDGTAGGQQACGCESSWACWNGHCPVR